MTNETVYAANDGPAAADVAATESAADDVADNDDDNDADEPLTQPAEAPELAAQGAADPAGDAKFLPLGVFSIAPEGQTEAAALVHLAVSKDGIVRGTYYDLKTDKDQTVHGAVNKENHSVAFTLGKGKTVYQTWLEDLIEEQSGPVTVKTGEGPSQTWTIARYTEEDDKKSGGADETKSANS